MREHTGLCGRTTGDVPECGHCNGHEVRGRKRWHTEDCIFAGHADTLEPCLVCVARAHPTARQLAKAARDAERLRKRTAPSREALGKITYEEEKLGVR